MPTSTSKGSNRGAGGGPGAGGCAAEDASSGTPQRTVEALARRQLEADAKDAGFVSLSVADPAKVGPEAGDRLEDALARGHHGDMGWLAATSPRRRHPLALWPEAKSVVMLAMDYGPRRNPLEDLPRRDRGVVAAYARGRDYHTVMKGKLKTLVQRMVARYGGDAKVFVDTAPVMEKPLAAAAGLGWQGKHTNLVSREYGSWLLLGTIFTTLALPPDAPHGDHCGSCRRCLDVCPTEAFPAPYQLDARRCLSYLTIEAKGMIPLQYRAAMGNRIFGCDDCLAVCPWNRFARAARDTKLAAADDEPAPLRALARLDDGAFRKRYAGTAVKRTGRERFVRNVMVAVGNGGDRDDADLVIANTADEAPQVRAAAIWAAQRILPQDAYRRLRAQRAPSERDPAVLAEWSPVAEEHP